MADWRIRRKKSGIHLRLAAVVSAGCLLAFPAAPANAVSIDPGAPPGTVLVDVGYSAVNKDEMRGVRTTSGWWVAPTFTTATGSATAPSQMAYLTDGGTRISSPGVSKPHPKVAMACGNNIAMSTGYYDDSPTEAHARNLASSTWRSRPVSDLIALQSAAPNGWIEGEPPNAFIPKTWNTDYKVVQVNASTGARTVLASWPNRPWGYGVRVLACDAAGVWLGGRATATTSTFIYHPWSGGLITRTVGVVQSPYYPGKATNVGSALLFHANNGYWYRLTPSEFKVAHIPPSSSQAALSATGYASVEQGNVLVERNLSGTVLRSRALPDMPEDLGPSGYGWALRLTSGPSGGLYVATPTAIIRKYAFPARRGYSGGDTGPGQVTWTDDRAAGHALVTRSVTRSSSGALSLGPAVRIYTGTSAKPLGPVTTSGHRAVVSTAYDHVLVDGTATRTLSTSAASVLGFSGHRILLGRELLDIRTGALTPIPSGSVQASLWGDRLAYTTTGKQVVIRNLATGTARAIWTAPSGYHLGTVATAGDYVAWRYTNPTIGQSYLVVRNLRTGSQKIYADRDDNLGISLTEHYVEHIGWRRNSDGALVANPPGSEISYSEDGVLWEDTKSSGGLVMSPLPKVAMAPRHLGAPMVPTAMSGSWHAEWAFSKALTSCQVKISRAGTVVRTLPCWTTYTRLGEAAVTWDRKLSTGALAPAGTYRYQLVAGNGSGAVQTTDGQALTLAGNITVS